MSSLLSRVLMSVVMLPGAAPMPSHGGGQATTNYRTDQVAVGPAVDGLTVGYDDADSSVTLTWTGPGELLVLGYENEPFMRVTPQGVERNIHSPATYLNQDRYARVRLPAEADAAAAPQWERISSASTVRWHDHRTHWMDPTPSPAVRANPDRITVVYPKWEIPLTVDGRSVSITGRLSWVPPPTQTPWVLLAVGLLIVFVGLAVATRRRSAMPMVVSAAAATVLFAVDSLGYLAAAPPNGSGRVLYVVWPVVLGVALVMATWRCRQPGKGVISLAVVGAVLAAVAGYDRLDAVNHSQVHSTLPAWFSRLSAVLCLAVGIAVMVAAVLRIFSTPSAASAASANPPPAVPSAP